MLNDCEYSTLEFTSPGDDLDSNDKVKEYIIKFSQFASNLTEVDTFVLYLKHIFLIYVYTDMDSLIVQPLAPPPPNAYF